MRILWFVNDPLPAVLRRMGIEPAGTGYWIPNLLEEMRRTTGLPIETVTVTQGFKDDTFEEDGIRYTILGQPKYQSFFNFRQIDLDRCRDLVRDRNPDIIHIHGTERFFGLLPARNLISTPCVISLQGLLGPYLPAFFGALSPREIWHSHRLIELATRRGLLWRYRDFAIGARQEREILSGARVFMGRTDWDRAHVQSLNPGASYYHVGEILRPQFAQARWSVRKCERHTVIFTNAGEPRRGTEVLLDAIQIVRREFPGARLLLAGSIGARRGYDRFLLRRIREKGLPQAVEFLGYLDGDAMARELERAHVFAISSYIENSPNSLCEAMQVGLPCAASYAGGIPGLVDHGRTGFLFPCGDAPLLADSILRIFRDDDLAARLGQAARDEATYRHAPERVVAQLLAAYNHAAGDGPYGGQFQAVLHAQL